jgi:hypothetical protein
VFVLQTFALMVSPSGAPSAYILTLVGRRSSCSVVFTCVPCLCMCVQRVQLSSVDLEARAWKCVCMIQIVHLCSVIFEAC